ncbi:MAG TPA: amidohydrolase [Thermoanaerobaculia bacterium]
MSWLFTLALFAIASSSSTDLLIEGATVYVAADAAPVAASILSRDGRIVFVGEASEARRRAKDPRVLSVAGATVLPGLADAHGHLYGLGRSLEIADLKGTASPAEAARRMAERAASLPAGAWAAGRGWDQNHWPGKAFPDARDLDTVLADRPAVADRVDGHAIWVNTAALKAAGIDASTPDPPGGRILRRPDGSPSGVLVDNAEQLVTRLAAKPSPADFQRRILAAASACARVGLTQVQDASAYDPDEIALLGQLAARGELPIRIYATVSPEEEPLSKAFARGTRIGRGADFLTVRAIKAYADGALGSRGAALLEEYADEPGKTGLLVMTPERLTQIAREADRRGWQVWIHAIGDRGNRIALDALAAGGGPAARHRIEHAQVIAPSDFPRFAREGVIASIQPTHATSDMPWAQARVGPERIKGAYAYRSLARAGAKTAGGSDFPVESENPMLGLYAAVARRDADGKPAGGWRPEEKLSRAEAVALFTSGAAWAAFEEKSRGRIAEGFDADFTVLSDDPLRVAEERIPGLETVATVVGGRVVYARETRR